jgi:hypothetical protein
MQGHLLTASEDAYRSLVEQGHSPEEIHRLQVCYQATALMVDTLIDNGYKAEHEVRGGWTVLEHSYVVIDTGSGEELIADPTWQQFLPDGADSHDMPRVLMGPRKIVAGQARSFGVDAITAQLWDKQETRVTAKQQREADQIAQDEADRAEDSGAWNKFMQQDK